MKRLFYYIYWIFFILTIGCNSAKLFCQSSPSINYRSFDRMLVLNEGAESMEIQFITDILDYDDCYYLINGEKKELIPENPGTTNILWGIPLIQGRNTLKIVIQGKKEGKYSTFVYDTIVEYKEYAYWILAIGTGDRQDSTSSVLPNLKYSINDASKFVNTVTEKAGVPEMLFVLNDRRATRNGIKSSFDSICEDVHKKNWIQEKAVVIYLSGHGIKDKDNAFCFQVKDEYGYDTDCIRESDFTDLLLQIIQHHNVTVWLFVDACNSQKAFRTSNQMNDGNISGTLIKYSSQIVGGSNYVSKGQVDVKKCRNIDQILKEGNNRETDYAIDGAFENFFTQSFTVLPIDADTLFNNVRRRYSLQNGKKPLIEDQKKINYPSQSEKKVTFPVGPPNHKQTAGGYLDIAIGWNFSRQWNPQIGYSWPHLSIFADFSGNYRWYRWPNDITHTMGITETDMVRETLPSKKIRSMGLGLRWYYNVSKIVDIGFSLSAQTGAIYGEKVVSDVEIIKHDQPFTCITPAATFRIYTSRLLQCKWFLNIGYALYFPYSINREMEIPPFQTNFGLSIPVYFKNTNNTERRGR